MKDLGFKIPDVDAATLATMDPDAVIELFGGEEAAQKAYNYMRFMHAQPEIARKDVLELARYCMRDPADYYNVDKSRYHVNIHHRMIADGFEEVLAGKTLRLALSIPPQHGKSTLAKMFLGSHVGRFPWKHLMFGTYNQDFAKENGDDLRSIVVSEEYQRVYPNVSLRVGSKAKDHMVTADGGKLSFLGRGGAGTGRPADGFLVDDFFKDAKEAESRTIRDDAWKWITRVVNSRLHKLSWFVIIATRWSDDDPIARLTDPKNPYYDPDVAKQWTVINVSAEMDDEEIAKALGKKVGDALWPERFPIELLHTAKKMDPIGYSALYMGKPTPPEGTYYKVSDIDEYRSIEMLPKNYRAYQTGDLAVSPERGADRSAVGIWLLDEHDTLWLHPDLFWARRASDDVVDELIERGLQHNILEAFYEKGQLDRAVGPFMEKRMAEKGAYYTVTRLPVAGDKGLRSTSIRGRMRQRKVKFPAFAPWWPAAKEEMLKFTGSGNDKADDFCDMIALIGQALGDTVVAGKGDNVVNFPKVGTFGWTVRAHKDEQAREQRRRLLRGM